MILRKMKSQLITNSLLLSKWRKTYAPHTFRSQKIFKTLQLRKIE